MVVKKFFGATTREALRQVRDELGPDALILSNRQVAGGGIEIMAVADADVAALTNVQTVATPAKPSPRAAQNGARLMNSAQSEAPSPNIAKALARSYAIPDDESEPSTADIAYEAPSVLRSNRQSRPAEPSFERENNEISLTQYASQRNAERSSERYTPDYTSEPAAARPAPTRRPVVTETQHKALPTFSFEDEPAKPAPAPVDHEAMQDIAREIRMLRGLLESQMAGMAWGELSKHAPEKLEILRQLLASGFCAALSRQLIDKMPSGMSLETGVKWVKAALAHNLPATAASDDLIARGGIYALIGPTGVGKTTTVAKLAARAALAYGPQSVALLTTDSYRIGAHDQLRIYGRILGVPVHDVKDETDLQLTLGELSDRHLVLIDTVGMGQRDQRIGEQLAMLGHDNVGTILLLAANAQAGTLDDVARRYRNHHLLGCILTKLDETVSLGGCLDVAIRHKLPLQFVTNGQRVPEDLHRANLAYLLDRAFKNQQDQGVFQLQRDEYPLFMSTQDTPTDFTLSLGGARA
ncbi:flagellar biosynthesis protein FlhF [Chitinibacter bivalviorum]|uniref:Flagellar biosynthesis protein FlhF n=1 Tax=Chitinibacter bivalviorum TaxID=2739434 RepID=A0A7H9BEX7_9NEIS|nr:flagellar biosynthesis protein FlhF [Chitinibacter bivalviorum]QLG86786.1 flagellar biosynthesis protein FlhF [Chitinibacter bivalviorum]